MLPLTDLSGLTVMAPFPDAEVVTGGISRVPLSVTSSPLLNVKSEHPGSNIATALRTTQSTCLVACFSALMRYSTCSKGSQGHPGHFLRQRRRSWTTATGDRHGMH